MGQDPRASKTKRNAPNTYFVQDSNDQERERLRIQDQMFTESMGGLLPEQKDPTRFQRIIDIGCGTGGWLIAVAQAYPEATQLVGIDANQNMIELAREQAAAAGIASNRLEFHKMDATLMIEFPQGWFDLVNQRFAGSYLRTWDWARQLQEYQRIARLGGTIRITEGSIGGETNSPALAEVYRVGREAFHSAGYIGSPEPTWLIDHIAAMMTQQGITDVQTRRIPITYDHHNKWTETFVEDMKLGFRSAMPFVRKWVKLPDSYERTYQQLVEEMQDPSFTSTWNLVTAWGTKGQPTNAGHYDPH